jgi:acetylornithine deacetylase/succinyl-diaminopimelate desuccinylase-like protein
VHGHNERVNIEAFKAGVGLYYQVLEQFLFGAP